MPSIRMLALDLDDTLLRSDLSISYRTRNAIKKAAAGGLVIALASGRVPAAMDSVSRLLGLHKRSGYLISNNGALIQESDTGKIVHNVQIEQRVALFAYDLAAAEGFAVQLYEDDIMYVSRPNEFTNYDQKITGLKQVVVENFRDRVAKGCNKLLIPGDPMLLKPLEKLLRAYVGKDANLFTSKPYFLEILPRETDKGSALAIVAEKLGINQETVLAIGDSMNDEAMIRWAGVGAAMVNGDERIKEIANFVTQKSNDDDGVADVIDQYILKPRGKQP